MTNRSENEVVDTFRALVTYGQADTSWLILHIRWCLRGLKWNPVAKKALYWLLTQEESYSDRDHLNDNETPIMILLLYAGWGDDTIPMLNLLIDKGVDLDAQKAGPDEDPRAWYTALHFIIRSTCASLYPYPPPDPYCGAVSHLLRRGANPHLPDRHGHTPTTMALAAGTLAFGFWKQVVRARKDIQEFVRRELAQSSSLRDAGWDEIALLNIFYCDFTPFRSYRPMYSITSRDWYGRSCAIVDRSREPWWFDLQELIRTKETPLPPLPRGWQKIKLDDRSFQYVETSTGTITNERPRAAFFANLQTRKAQSRYRKGMITIETEGCETELDDWCSDEDGGSSEDSEEECRVFKDESKATWSDKIEGVFRTSEGDGPDTQETELERDSTCQAFSSLLVKDLGDSDEEDEFHDAQTTPFTYPDGP